MADVGQVLVIFLVLVVAIVIGFCCHFASLKRREQERAANLRVQQQAAGINANQTRGTSPVYVFGLQGAAGNSNSTAAAAREEPTSQSAEDQVEESVPVLPMSPDAIADCGPPSYRCLATDELPPPSYEEALRLSNENLAGT